MSRTLARRRSITLLIAACLTLAMCAAASADTFPVTTPNDSDDGACTPSLCSLRDAINAADAGAAGSTVVVPAGHYLLNTTTPILGELAVSKNMTISGAGARSTIVDGNGASRVFDITSTGPAPIRIENLTVTNGQSPPTSSPSTPPPSADVNDAGGILDDGVLQLSGVTVSHNSAQFSGGGISTPGLPLPVFEGGPTTAPASVTIDHSTISDNTVTGGAGNGEGGGLQVFGNLVMTDSTVSGNSVSDPGTNLGGGMIAVASGTPATLRNDTIAGNSVALPPSSPPPVGPPTDDGGGIAGGDESILGGTTGSPNPASAALDAENTIVANNTADGATNDCASATVSSTTTDHNLSGDSSCGFTDAGSKQNTDPQLGALTDNGGPTDTQALTAASPAVDAGDGNGCPSQDQRNVVRPQGAACDMGAFEYAPPIVTTGPATAVTSNGATLTGSAGNPAPSEARVAFQFGASTGYGAQTATVTLAPGTSTGVQIAMLPVLPPSTTYHYRLIAQNGDGTSYGADATFTTAAAPPATTQTQSTSTSTPPPPVPSKPAVPTKPKVKIVCTSKRHFTVHLFGVVSGAHVTLDGHSLTIHSGRLMTVNVNLRSLRLGAYVLRITGVNARGHTVHQRRTYHTCRRRLA